jgi:hypothetical protein
MALSALTHFVHLPSGGEGFKNVDLHRTAVSAHVKPKPLLIEDASIDEPFCNRDTCEGDEGYKTNSSKLLTSAFTGVFALL